MSLAKLFYMKETFRERVRQWRQACFRKRSQARREQRFTLEALEPRLLLSAAPVSLESLNSDVLTGSLQDAQTSRTASIASCTVPVRRSRQAR